MDRVVLGDVLMATYDANTLQEPAEAAADEFVSESYRGGQTDEKANAYFVPGDAQRAMQASGLFAENDSEYFF